MFSLIDTFWGEGGEEATPCAVRCPLLPTPAKDTYLLLSPPFPPSVLSPCWVLQVQNLSSWGHWA